MATQVPELDEPTRRQMAAGLFNLVWKHLENPQRSAADDEAMLHAAHASRYFWSTVGVGKNFARGEWQLSRVYSVRRRGEPALHHAQRCLALCEENGLGAFDVAFAHEALARGYAVAGDGRLSEQHRALAREFGEKLDDAEDREWLKKNLESVPAASAES